MRELEKIFENKLLTSYFFNNFESLTHKLPINTHLEVTKVMALLEKERGKRPTVLFDCIENYPEKLLLMNPFKKGTICNLLSTSTSNFLPNIYQRLKSNRYAFPRVEPTAYQKASKKLDDIPILKHQPQDSGPYITAGITATMCPETNLINLGIYRLRYIDQETLIIFMNAKTDGYRNYLSHKNRNEETPVSIFIGAEPEFYLAAAGSFPFEKDSYLLCSQLATKSISLIDLPVPVPSSSQYIIQGYITEKQKEEGAFGEFKGFYNISGHNPILKVENVLIRNGAFYTSIIPGEESGLTLMAVPNEIKMYQMLVDKGYEITDVRYMLDNGLGEFTVVIETPDPMEVIIRSAWDIDPRVKFVICGIHINDPWKDVNIFPITAVNDIYLRKGKPDGMKIGFILQNSKSSVEWVEIY